MKTSLNFGNGNRLARIFRTPLCALINTVASARCSNALTTPELFQQFACRSEKPLKRLTARSASLHRAEATVLMRPIRQRYVETAGVRNAKEAGFTMVELALSLAIIAFSMVAIMGVLPAGLQVQKANREDTIMNQEGAFFLEAIKNGSMGYDQLLDYVDGLKISRTNASGGGVYPLIADRGFRIIGRLSTPKYEIVNKLLTTNTITAKIRPLTGAASHKGVTVAARSMALSYLLQSEVVPYSAFPTNFIGTNFNAAASTASDKLDRSLLYAEGQSLASTLYEIRLTIRWPVYELRNGQLTNWTTGPNVKTFRTLISGKLQRLQDTGGSQPVSGSNAGQNLYFFRPFIYTGL